MKATTEQTDDDQGPPEWEDLIGHLERINVRLEQVYLDPNNPRFGDSKDKKESRFTEAALQQRAAEKLERDPGVSDLVQSIHSSGFLPVDSIVVRELSPDTFVVVEGNRRICAMRRLHADNLANEIELSPKTAASIAQFDVLVYRGSDPDIAWRIQGLRHILGIKSWGPLQEAMSLEKRLEQLRKAHQGKGRPPGIPAVARAIGVSPARAATLVRSLRGYMQAKKECEQGERIDLDHFSTFSEAVFRREVLQHWLGWNDDVSRFERVDNLNKLLEWTLPQQENGKEAPPRIRRVNPDLRDILPQILHDASMMARFEAGELTMEKAQVELQSIVDRAVPQELEAFLRRLDEVERAVESLPLPRIVQGGRALEFAEKLKQIRGALEIQLGFLGEVKA
jgi:hypothetical protein